MATSAEDETVISKKQEKMFWYKVRLIDCNEDQRSEAEDLKTEVYEVLNKPPIRQDEDFYDKFICGGGNPELRLNVIEYTPQRVYYMGVERGIVTKYIILQKDIELEIEFMKMTSLQDLSSLEICKRVKDNEKLYKVIPRRLVFEVEKFR